MDNAVEDILNTINKKINSIQTNEFNLSKRKNFDSISSERLNLNKLTLRNFNIIVEDKYNFYNFLNMEKFSKSIKLDDLKSFFSKKFKKEDLSLTIYVILSNKF